MKIINSALIIGFILLIPFKHIDSELNPFYNKFMNALKEHCDIKAAPQFVLKFGKCGDPNNEHCVAYCDPGKLRQDIYVDKEYFDRVNEFGKMIVVWHELSHCILNARHSTDKDNYMYPILPIGITKAEFYNQVYQLMEEQCQK